MKKLTSSITTSNKNLPSGKIEVIYRMTPTKTEKKLNSVIAYSRIRLEEPIIPQISRLYVDNGNNINLNIFYHLVERNKGLQIRLEDELISRNSEFLWDDCNPWYLLVNVDIMQIFSDENDNSLSVLHNYLAILRVNHILKKAGVSLRVYYCPNNKLDIFKSGTTNFTGQENPEFILVDLNPNLQILPHCRLSFDGKLLSDDTPIHSGNNLLFMGIDSTRFEKILNRNKVHVRSLLERELPNDIKRLLQEYETKLNYLINNYTQLPNDFVEDQILTLNILYSTIFSYVNTGNCLFVNLSKSEFLAEWAKLTKIQFFDKSTNITKLKNYISSNPDKFPNLLGLRNRSGGCFTEDQFNGILSGLTQLPSGE